MSSGGYDPETGTTNPGSTIEQTAQGILIEYIGREFEASSLIQVQEQPNMTPNQIFPIDWIAVADAFCKAWSSNRGSPDYDYLANLYAPDNDVIIYDTLPPLNGFLGFTQLRSEIYPGLEQIAVERTGDVVAREMAAGHIVVTCYPFRLQYVFADGRKMSIDARISEVWERRSDGYRIIHEHPSTVYDMG